MIQILEPCCHFHLRLIWVWTILQQHATLTSFIVTHSWTTESDPWCWQSNSGPRRTTSTRQGFKPCPHTHCRWWWSIIYRLVLVLLFFLVCRGHIPTSSTPTVIFSIFLTTFHSTNQTTKIQLVNFLLVSSSTSLIMKGKRTKLLVWNILSSSSINFFLFYFSIYPCFNKH